MEQKLVKIPSMNCEYCSQTVRKTIGAIEGVEHVEVHLAAREVLVRWKEPATWAEIAKLLDEIGYPAEINNSAERD